MGHWDQDCVKQGLRDAHTALHSHGTAQQKWAQAKGDHGSDKLALKASGLGFAEKLSSGRSWRNEARDETVAMM